MMNKKIKSIKHNDYEGSGDEDPPSSSQKASHQCSLLDDVKKSKNNMEAMSKLFGWLKLVKFG